MIRRHHHTQSPQSPFGLGTLLLQGNDKVLLPPTSHSNEKSILIPHTRSHMTTALGRRLGAQSLLPGPGAQAGSASAELKEDTECEGFPEEQCESRPRKKRWLLGKMAVTLGGEENFECGVINSGCSVLCCTRVCT